MYVALLHKISYYNAKLFIVHINGLLDKIKAPSEKEKMTILESRMWRYYRNPDRIDELVPFYDDLYDNKEDIKEAFDFAASGAKTIQRNGIRLFADVKSRFYNVVNSRRVTTDSPEKHDRRLFLFGNCCAAGAFVEDKYTCASYLQRMLNEKYPDKIQVINAANWRGFSDTVRQMLSPHYEFQKNDIIVIITNDIDKHSINTALSHFKGKEGFVICHMHDHEELSTIFEKGREPGQEDMLFDQQHMTHRGYKILAGHICKHVSSHFIDDQIQDVKNPISSLLKENEAYLEKLKEIRQQRGDIGLKIGSIVMNCNPFTLGHEYLVHEARKNCDYLYIFVLEEDKSYFTFQDRLEMVRRGLSGLENICIIPSSKLIISSDTMPEYFSKDEQKDAVIDTSYDLDIFSTVIAPILDINMRFAGTEPYCNITRQYNQGMREILPRHGIEFVEIPRKNLDIEPISASETRKRWESGERDKILEMVPLTTYEYLLEACSNDTQATAESQEPKLDEPKKAPKDELKDEPQKNRPLLIKIEQWCAKIFLSNRKYRKIVHSREEFYRDSKVKMFRIWFKMTSK